MALPTQKRSKTRKKIKQYKNRLKKKVLSVCPQCKKPVLPHHICLSCGKYSNREIIQPRAEEKKKKGKEKKEKK